MRSIGLPQARPGYDADNKRVAPRVVYARVT